MKKYLTFAIGFVVLFLLFEFTLGFFITFMFAPDVTGAWDQSILLPPEVWMTGIPGSSFSYSLLFGLFSATIAYFIANKVESRE
ncbi:MAG TPA: hypothetical protein VIG73_05335 [Cerasibacillus sp.]|uniref:hypothetical protein n=1 Tax=Cerasibacillus sp. TaxID=2498711 RepID=UPI002F40C3E7